MAATAAQVIARIEADLSGFRRGMATAREETNQQQGWFRGVMGSMAGAAGGFLAAAGIQFGLSTLINGFKTAITSAAQFQQGLTSLVTGAGLAQGSLGYVRNAILAMSVTTGTSTQQLISGMYMISSAGFNAKDGLKILLAAAEGAKVGMADLGTVADATTTIMVDFGKTGISASQAVNLLIATVAAGKTHMQDLAGALSSILPVASAAKIKLTDVMAAMATMTQEGVPAADAATYLRQMLIMLDAPGSQAVKTLKSIGLTSADVAKAMQISLPGALQLITDALAKKFPPGSAAYIEALKQIMGGSKDLQAMFDLTGDHLNTFITNASNLSGVAKKGGDSITGWAKVQDDFNQKIDKAKAVIDTLLIRLGDKLLPILGKVADAISSNLTPTVNNMIDAAKTAAPVVENIVGWFIQWHDPILAVAAGLTLFFIPAIISSGVESVIAGTKIAVNFVANIIKSGIEGWNAVARLAIWVAQITASGVQAIWAGGKIAVNWIASVLAGGTAAATSAGEVEALAVSEESAGVSAETAAPELDTLAASEAAVGDAATGAAGTAAGAGAGVLGLLAAIVGVGDYLSVKLPGDWIRDQLTNMIRQLTGAANDARTGVLTMGSAIQWLNGVATGFKGGRALVDSFHGVSGAALAMASAIDAARNALIRLDNTPPPAYSPGGGHPHFASGGIMPYTGVAKVGEYGPELVILPGGSQVLNSQQTQALGAGWQQQGPQVVHNHHYTINAASPASMLSQLKTYHYQQKLLYNR